MKNTKQNNKKTGQKNPSISVLERLWSELKQCFNYLFLPQEWVVDEVIKRQGETKKMTTKKTPTKPKRKPDSDKADAVKLQKTMNSATKAEEGDRVLMDMMNKEKAKKKTAAYKKGGKVKSKKK